MSRPRLLLLCVCLFGPIGFAYAQDDPRVIFDAGFYNEEWHKDQRWRWMAEEGVVKLKNQRRDMILKFTGRAPLDAMPQKPTMKVFLNGEELEKFDPPEHDFDKEYKVSAAKLGAAEWVDLRITTTKFIVPSEVNKKLNDDRHLGFKLYKLTWTSVAGDEPPPPAPEERPPPSKAWLVAGLIIGATFVMFLVGAFVGSLVARQRRPGGYAATFCCASCKEKALAELAGKKIACTQCGKLVQVPKTNDES